MKVSRELAEKIHRDLLQAIQALGQGHLDQAEAICQSILKQIPTHPDAFQVLGLVESNRQNFDRAIEYFEKSLRFDPSKPDVWVMLGNAFSFVREVEKAEKAFNQALNLDPKNDAALLWLGMAALGRGDEQGAQELLTRAIEANPGSAQPYSILTKLKGFNADASFIQNLETITKQGGQSKLDSIFAHYALANWYYRQKDKEKFTFYINQANELQSLMTPAFDTGAEDQVRASKEAFTTEIGENQAMKLEEAPTPIFLIGLPRSGSTLVEQILSCHEKVFAGDELLFAHSHLIPGVEARAPYPSGVGNLSPEDWQRIGDAYIGRLETIAKGAPFVTDKLLTNLFHIGLIRMALPQAKVVYVRRNALDTAFSIYSNYFLERMAEFSDLGKMAAHFRLVNDIMVFWKDLFPGFILEIQYEDMIKNQEKETRKILDFCGLEWDPACLDFQNSDRQVFTTSLTQIREPVYTSSIGKWKEYTELLEPFKVQISDLIDEDGFLKS